MEWQELHRMKVSELRDKAKDVPSVTAESATRDELIAALAKAHNIVRPNWEYAGSERARVKLAIRALKKERETAKAAGDHAAVDKARTAIHLRKRALRRVV